MVSSTNLSGASNADSDVLKSFITDKDANAEKCMPRSGSFLKNAVEIKGSSLRQVTAAFIANLGTINTGLTFGFAAVANPQLVDGIRFYKINENETSWVASLSSIGTPLGCMVSAYLTDMLGRKRTLVVTELPAIIGWGMIALAPSIEWIYIGRVLTGVSSGMIGAPSRVYTAEVSQPHLRGILSALASVGASLGVAIEYLLGSLFDWRTLSWISGIIPIISLVTSLLLPESPSWLIASGQKQKCFNSLKQLRGSTCDVQREVNNLVEFAEKHNPSSKMTIKEKLRNLTHPSVVKPFFILSMYFFFYQMSGSNPLTFYSVFIFRDSGTKIDKYLATVITGVIRLIFTIVGCVLMLRCGRRSLTFLSSIGCGITMLILGSYIFMLENWKTSHVQPIATWIPVATIFFFTAASTVGYLIVPWVMVGELYPVKVRGMVGSFTTGMCHLFIFMAVQTYPILKRWFTPCGPFLIYGCISLIGTIFLYVYLPETKDKSLQEIEEYFSGPEKREPLMQKKKPIVIHNRATESIV